MKATNLTTFDGVIPNEIGGLNAFEALLAGHRMNKPTLDTDCVARAYPMVWQTVRCLNKVPVTPAAVADGCGRCEVGENRLPVQCADRTRFSKLPGATMMQRGL